MSDLEQSTSSDDDTSPLAQKFENAFPLRSAVWLYLPLMCQTFMSGFLLTWNYARQKTAARTASECILAASLLLILICIPAAKASATLAKLERQHRSELDQSMLIQYFLAYTKLTASISWLSLLHSAGFFYSNFVLGYNSTWPLWLWMLQIAGSLSLAMGYCSFTVQYVVRSYVAADIMLQGLITQLEARTEIFWDEFAAAVHEASQEIDDLFSLSQVGRAITVGSAVCVVGVVSGMTSIVLAGTDTRKPFFMEGCVFFFTSLTALCVMLFPLSRLATKFEDGTTSANSILAAASRYPYEAHGMTPCNMIPEAQRAAYTMFITRMASGKMGVKLLGVRITQRKVASAFLKLGIALPSIYAFLEASFASVLKEMQLKKD